jgi:hypothetical protein
LAKLKGLKLTKNNVEQTINLKELFGVDFRGSRSLREAIGGAIIEKIRARSSQGLGVGGVKLKSPYSKSYSKSLDFKAAGKSKNNVNMQLTGDMLGLLDIKKQSGNEITIGWKDSSQNPKAYNHQTGDTVPRRPFFGVSQSDLKEIKKSFRDEIKSALKSENKREFESKVAGLLDKIEDTFGESED